jgi:hypothetical protein
MLDAATGFFTRSASVAEERWLKNRREGKDRQRGKDRQKDSSDPFFHTPRLCGCGDGAYPALGADTFALGLWDRDVQSVDVGALFPKRRCRSPVLLVTKFLNPCS